MSNITMGFEYVGEEFEKCPDCSEEQQIIGFKKLVIVLRHDDKIKGYKCGWCRGKLTTKKEDKIMGNRAQVFIEEEGVYLYTHWGADHLVGDVRNALERKERWDDPEYLVRIVFCEMIRGDENGTEGFGIGTSKHGDIWRLITLTKDKRVKVKDHGHLTFEGTYEEFIKQTFE